MQAIKIVSLALLVMPVALQAEAVSPAMFNGTWVLNEELSDDTDRQVEKAIKQAGGKASTRKKGKGRYKGGPKEQALYDHMAYDEVLRITLEPPAVRFVYQEGFERVFYTDGRPRSANATGPRTGGRRDYSFAALAGNTLYVEARPQDGGQTTESYTLSSKGMRLRVTLNLQPLSFLHPIEIVRIYERYQDD